MEKGNLLLVHGGAPTAVMNASLYGAIAEAKRHPEVDRILGANGGTAGLLNEDFIDLTDLTEEQMAQLLMTPGTVIGTSRTPLYEAEYQKMADVVKKHNIKYLLFNGGNGTMDACGHAHAQCNADGVRTVGIPKTIDNDIAVTDHAPGFASAARYLAATVSEVCQDVHSLPIHVCVIEAMGRNAGWLTASAALAEEGGYVPDLIYLPERDFDEETFLRDVKAIYDRKGCAVVVASEGLHYAGGTPIVEPIFRTDRAVYYGDVGAHLANLVIRKLGIKARSEKPGICGRASYAHQSPVDRDEAVECGKRAAALAIEGQSGVMVTIEREEGSEYAVRYGVAPIEKVMLDERKMPDEYINEAGNGVTEAFKQWCRPMLGEALPKFLHLDKRA